MDFNAFVQTVIKAQLSKAGQAASFVWWAENREDKHSLSMDEICSYFARARLSPPNRTRLDRDLRRARFVWRDKLGKFQLTQAGIQEGKDLFANFHVSKQEVDDAIPEIDLGQCPYIEDADIDDARRMAALYVTLFCLENSMRRYIEKVLAAALGANWWDLAASASMKRKEEDRRNNEKQNKWIPARSKSGPLYSLDWPDLVTLIRKHEHLFRDVIPDMNFLHRFSDLGNLRNVVAHNGVIEESMQFRRVELAFHDWQRQVGS